MREKGREEERIRERGVGKQHMRKPNMAASNTIYKYLL